MKKTFQISISNPCTVPWEDMKVVPAGRFCSVCEKTVTDFTQFTDEELIAYFRKGRQPGACGKFTRRQLTIDITTESRAWVPFLRPAKWAAALSLIAGTMAAPVAARNRVSEMISTPVDQGQKPRATPDTVKVYGVVQDEKGEPMPGAVVLLMNTRISIYTDMDGRFELQPEEVQDEYKIKIRAMGVADQEVTIKSNSSVTIAMKLLPPGNDDNEFEVYGGMQ